MDSCLSWINAVLIFRNLARSCPFPDRWSTKLFSSTPSPLVALSPHDPTSAQHLPSSIHNEFPGTAHESNWSHGKPSAETRQATGNPYMTKHNAQENWDSEKPRDMQTTIGLQPRVPWRSSVKESSRVLQEYEFLNPYWAEVIRMLNSMKLTRWKWMVHQNFMGNVG